jgi:hypothetical protein
MQKLPTGLVRPLRLSAKIPEGATEWIDPADEENFCIDFRERPAPQHYHLNCSSIFSLIVLDFDVNSGMNQVGPMMKLKEKNRIESRDDDIFSVVT